MLQLAVLSYYSTFWLAQIGESVVGVRILTRARHGYVETQSNVNYLYSLRPKMDKHLDAACILCGF